MAKLTRKSAVDVWWNEGENGVMKDGLDGEKGFCSRKL